MKHLLCISLYILFLCSRQLAMAGTNEPVTIQLQKVSTHQGLRTVQVSIGNQHLLFLFSTGSGITSISTAAAKTCGLTTDGIVKNTDNRCVLNSGLRIPLMNVAFGEYFTSIENVMVSDEPVQQAAEQGVKVDGILALNAFPNNILTIDLMGNRLILENEQSMTVRKAGLLELASVFTSGNEGYASQVFLQSTIAGHPLRLLFDTGNDDNVILSKEAAKSISAAPDSIIDAASKLNIKDQPIAVHDAIAETLHCSVTDLCIDGRLNFSFISGNSWTIDQKHRKLYIEP